MYFTDQQSLITTLDEAFTCYISFLRASQLDYENSLPRQGKGVETTTDLTVEKSFNERIAAAEACLELKERIAKQVQTWMLRDMDGVGVEEKNTMGKNDLVVRNMKEVDPVGSFKARYPELEVERPFLDFSGKLHYPITPFSAGPSCNQPSSPLVSARVEQERDKSAELPSQEIHRELAHSSPTQNEYMNTSQKDKPFDIRDSSPPAKGAPPIPNSNVPKDQAHFSNFTDKVILKNQNTIQQYTPIFNPSNPRVPHIPIIEQSSNDSAFEDPVQDQSPASSRMSQNTQHTPQFSASSVASSEVDKDESLGYSDIRKRSPLSSTIMTQDTSRESETCLARMKAQLEAASEAQRKWDGGTQDSRTPDDGISAQINQPLTRELTPPVPEFSRPISGNFPFPSPRKTSPVTLPSGNYLSSALQEQDQDLLLIQYEDVLNQEQHKPSPPQFMSQIEKDILTAQRLQAEWEEEERLLNSYAIYESDDSAEIAFKAQYQYARDIAREEDERVYMLEKALADAQRLADLWEAENTGETDSAADVPYAYDTGLGSSVSQAQLNLARKLQGEEEDRSTEVQRALEEAKRLADQWSNDVGLAASSRAQAAVLQSQWDNDDRQVDDHAQSNRAQAERLQREWEEEDKKYTSELQKHEDMRNERVKADMEAAKAAQNQWTTEARDQENAARRMADEIAHRDAEDQREAELNNQRAFAQEMARVDEERAARIKADMEAASHAQQQWEVDTRTQEEQARKVADELARADAEAARREAERMAEQERFAKAERDRLQREDEERRKQVLEAERAEAERKARQAYCASHMEAGDRADMAEVPCRHWYCGDCLDGTIFPHTLLIYLTSQQAVSVMPSPHASLLPAASSKSQSPSGPASSPFPSSTSTPPSSSSSPLRSLSTAPTALAPSLSHQHTSQVL